MTNLKTPRHRRTPTIAALIVAASAVFASAQTTTEMPTDDGDVTTLSPFTVSTDTDVGYLAANSLAGSRLNTSLKDTAASISVLTQEMMQDLAAFDISEALLYANNLQIDNDDAGSFGDSPNGNSTAEFHQQYRVRGLAATVARNYFAWLLPSDSYNVERIEDSRGPNSVLFGIGSAGGVINVSTKQAKLKREIHALSYAFGSNNLWRAALDYNQPLLEGKAAFRLNLLVDDKDSFRHYQFKENFRVHLATKWQVMPNTSLRIEYEYGDVKDNNPRTYNLFDYSPLWRDAGRTSYDGTPSAAIRSAEGIGTYGSANRLTYIGNDGSLFNMRGEMLTTSGSLGTSVLDDRSLADYSINVNGPGGIRTTELDTFTAVLEHRFSDKTFLELAYNYQSYDFVSHDTQANANRLYGDPNNTRPDGSINPYAGDFMLETTWRRFLRNESAETVRATLSSMLDLDKWGYYRFALMGEYEAKEYLALPQIEVWAGRPFNADPANGANRVYRRNYVADYDWQTYYVNGPAQTGLLKGVTADVVGTSYTLDSTWTGQNNAVSDDPSTRRSALVGMQAGYLDGRISLGTGFRYDRLITKDRGAKRDPATNEWAVDYDTVNEIDNDGTTFTAGVVGHVTKNISLIANTARNNAVPDPRVRLMPDGEAGDPPQGKGTDFGVAIELLDGKIYARAVRFTTSEDGFIGFRFGGSDSNPTAVTGRILNALVGAGAYTVEGADALRSNSNGATWSRETEGYEFQLIGNPTKNLRVQLNYSINDGIESDIAPEIMQWWAETEPFWRDLADQYPAVTTSSSNRSIDAELDEFQDEIDLQRSVEGIGLIGNRKNKVNLLVRYSFTDGTLKGAFLGAGYRYQGRMLAGKAADTQTVYTPGTLLYAPSTDSVEAFVGYTWRLGGGRKLSMQLNVNNLFDKHDALPTRYGTNNPLLVNREVLVPPRSWRLSGTFSF